MFQWSHAFSVALDAKFTPHKHADQEAGVYAPLSGAAGQLSYADMEAKY